MKYVYLLLLAVATPLFAEVQMLKLKSIVDGDTVKFYSKGSSKQIICRLAYIDTPESKPNAKAKRDMQKGRGGVTVNEIVSAGRLSTRYVKSILRKGTPYRVNIKGNDRFGRSICIISDNGISINDKIIKNGFGVPFWKHIPAYKRMYYRSLHSFSQKHKKGLWKIYPSVMSMMAK